MKHCLEKDGWYDSQCNQHQQKPNGQEAVRAHWAVTSQGHVQSS